MLKEKEDNKKYLFKSGNFYIFIDEDAKYISSVTTLKITNFGNTVKCGFPLSSLSKYLEIFNNINSDIVLVDNRDSLIKEVSKLNLNILTKEELISIIDRFVECV